MHIAKYNRSSIGHILGHNEPTTARANRSNVDTELTAKNYNFVCNKGIYNLHRVLSCVYCSPRKDTNIICSCVVTAPKSLPPELYNDFFKGAFDFLKARYNCPCIQACVHFDEPNAQPHLHYVFCPTVFDNKKNRLKVCAKEVVTRADLLSLHSDFKSYIDNRLNADIDILNSSSSKNNLSVMQLRSRELQADIKKLTKLKSDLLRQIERERVR